MQGQVWRLFTAYLYFGTFSVDFLIHLYFLVRYSRLLEEGDFRGRTANYILFFLFGIANMTLVACYLNVHFLGHALTFMMTYVWGRRNEDVKMSFLGVLTFHAPYLPWVLLTFNVLIGSSITMDLIGIAGKEECTRSCKFWFFFLSFVFYLNSIRGKGNSPLFSESLFPVGHLYYFLEYVYPKVAQVRGFRVKRIMEPPALLHYMCGSYEPAVVIEHEEEHLHQD